MSEDERTLWCGNLSERVTEELLYELCLQAGPVENVKIPRDADKRQRSYAFITYAHACSVDYAMRIFEGSSLFKRTLTLHRKNRNGPNPAASPNVNFQYPSGSGRSNDGPAMQTQDPSANMSINMDAGWGNGRLDMGSNTANNPFAQNDILSAMALAMNIPSHSADMFVQLGQQMLGAELPAYEDNDQQKGTYRTKMNHHDRHHKNPYAREERYGRDHDRNDTRSRHRHENDSRRNGQDRDQKRDHRRRR